MNTAPPELIVVGSGRSGTTILLEAIAAAVPGVAAVPRLAGRVPQLTGLATWLAKHEAGPLGWRRPSAESTALFTEAGLTQSLQCGLGGATVTADDVPAALLAHLPRRLDTVRRRSGRPTVVLKNTASCGRVPVLRSLLPQARFVHVVRSPSEVVASLLKSNFFHDMSLWWDGRTTRQYAEDTGLSLERVAARHWARQVAAASRDLQALAPEDSITIEYATFTRQPVEELSRLSGFGLAPPDAARLYRLDIRPASRPTPPEIAAAVQEECLELTEQIGVAP